MLAEAYIVPQCAVRPDTIGGLVTLYESNFIKLASLVPGMASATTGSFRVSTCARDLDLHLSVEAATRYTVDLRLTYLFADAAGLVPEPDLQLRAYLDARVVEVLGWAAGHRHEWLRSLAGEGAGELDRRWARNIMLGKWLDYLLEHGHGFPAS